MFSYYSISTRCLSVIATLSLAWHVWIAMVVLPILNFPLHLLLFLLFKIFRFPNLNDV